MQPSHTLPCPLALRCHPAGVEVPPEAWGDNVITLTKVNEIATYTRSNGGSGVMMWSLHKAGNPGPQAIAQTVCKAYGMFDCTTALPM